jgi:flagellar biogenesis protein FliO
MIIADGVYISTGLLVVIVLVLLIFWLVRRF